MPKEFILSINVPSSGKIEKECERLEASLVDGNMDITHSLSKEMFQKVVERAVAGAIACGSECGSDHHTEFIDNAIKIKETYPLPEEMLKKAVADGLERLLSNYMVRSSDVIQKIKGNFPLPTEEILKKIVKKGLVDILSGDKLDLKLAFELKKEFSLSENEFGEIVRNEFARCLSHGDWDVEPNNYEDERLDSAVKIKDTFSLTDEMANDIFPDYFPSGFTYKNLLEMRETPQIGAELSKSIVNLKNFSFYKEIQPIIKAQGEAAFLYFQTIKRIPNYQNLSPEDIEYIVYVGKKYGTQSRNILENILMRVESINKERDFIEEYIQEIRVVDFNIYEEFKLAKEENDSQKIDSIKKGVNTLQEGMYKGNLRRETFGDSFYNAVSYYTFPPAIGLTQDQYAELNSSRPDRRTDVPESLNELNYQKFEVSTGKYSLGEGEELNLDKWTSLGNAVKKVNKEVEKEGKTVIDEEEIAEKLIAMYRGKNSEAKENQEYLFENMYRYHLIHGGGKLESNFTINITGLMQYKEFIGDRIKNDLIKQCLMKWKETHQKEFEELKSDTMNRLKTTQSQNFSKVKNMLSAIDKQKDANKKAKAVENLDAFLQNFGISYEMIKDEDIDDIKRDLEAVVVEYEGDLTEENYRSEEYYNSEAFLRAYDEFTAKHDNEQLLYQKISSDLVAGINKKMRKEVDKFKFEGEAGQVKKRKLEFVVSKKKEHGVAGYNMGVCVTPDEELWNDPQFMNCIMFDPELKQAMGGMHFLVRENNLCLPGINPSLDILGKTKNEELFEKMIEFAKKVKEKSGLDKVLIPTASEIHSNRTQIQEIIRKKAYKQYGLQEEASFSHRPYQYSFQECFEIV